MPLQRYIGMRFLKYAAVVLAAIISISVSPLSSKAETVSQKQASKIAEAFFNTLNGIYVAAPKMVWNGRQLTTDRLFSPFYIYNHPNGGFVIVAADTKAFPILGYSRSGRFDRAVMTDDEKELLTRYAHEIELIRYDDRQPERAIAAWRNLPLFINKMIHNPYDTPEFNSLTDEAKERLEAIDRRGASVMMPTAVEFPIYNPGDFRDYILDDVLGEPEEIPFSFFEDFMRDVENERNTRAAEFEEILSPTKPMIESHSGAHLTIRFPEEMTMVVVYSMQGLRQIEKYYKDTNVINLDLSILPAGFYALVARDINGKLYGLKIYR